MKGKRLEKVLGHIEKANRLRKVSVVLFAICGVIVLMMVMAKSLTFDVRIFGLVIAFWFLVFGVIARVSASREDKEFFNEFEG
jgi:amino acid transporter